MCGNDMSKMSENGEEGEANNFFDEAFNYWQRKIRYLTGEGETTKPGTGKVFNTKQEANPLHTALKRVFDDVVIKPENNKLENNDSYAPSIFKASQKVTPDGGNDEKGGFFSSILNLDFNPFSKDTSKYEEDPAVKQLEDQLRLRKFEEEGNRSITFNSGTIVNNVKYAEHGNVVGQTTYEDFYSGIEEEVFTDPIFPPEKSSVLGYGCGEDMDQKPRDASAQKFSTVHYDWKRAGNIMGNVSVIVDGVKPSDIYQGSLGDCYFLSSISALAEFPDRVERLILNSSSNEKGCYAVALNINGDWKEVFLDDLFPTHRRKIIFCHSSSAELWAMLLEKAYAKVYNGYWNIGTGGFAEDALKDLTGAPTEFDTISEETDLDALWKRLDYCDRMRYIIVCGSKGSGEAKTDMGIIQGHAYTIIACHLFKGRERVLEMRNPWGDHNEWNGKYGDDDSHWTDELRQKYDNVESKDDGRFFMPFEDFVQYFDQFAICLYNDDSILSSFTEELESEFLGCYTFHIETEGEYFISLSQPDSRGFDVLPSGEEYAYSCNGILVCENSGGKMKYLGGKQGELRDVWVKAKLAKGEVYVFVKTNWLHPDVNIDFGLSTYGPERVQFRKVLQNQSLSLPGMLKQALLNKALSEGDDEWSRLGKSGTWGKVYSNFEHSNIGYGFYAFRNESSKKIQVTLKMTKKLNVRFLTPEGQGQDGETCVLVVNANSSNIAIWDIYGDASSISFKTGMKVV